MSEPTIRECPVCPDYVAQCWHVDELAVWMLTRANSRAEKTRRGIGPQGCPRCGRSGRRTKAPFGIGGPGHVMPPVCLCDSGLTWPDDQPEAWTGFNSLAEAIAEGDRRIRELT